MYLFAFLVYDLPCLVYFDVMLLFLLWAYFVVFVYRFEVYNKENDNTLWEINVICLILQWCFTLFQNNNKKCHI